MVYGIEQSNHGHAYRWIVSNETAESVIADLESNESHDIGWPIGGSNSSSTLFVELHSDDDVKEFLEEEFKTDYEDPALIDIAEGILTICIEKEPFENLTGNYVKKFGYKESYLTRDNAYFDECVGMLLKIDAAGIECGIEFDEPFYGKSRYMRLSELRKIYDRIK